MILAIGRRRLTGFSVNGRDTLPRIFSRRSEGREPTHPDEFVGDENFNPIHAMSRHAYEDAGAGGGLLTPNDASPCLRKELTVTDKILDTSPIRKASC
jgi:hypothetical protein